MIFADNSTVVAYHCKSGGTLSSALNSTAQRILRWAEDLRVVLAPQFIMEANNVLDDSLSRTNQLQSSEWTLKLEVIQELRKKWLVMVGLFATSSNHCCSLYFSPFHNPQALGTDAFLHSWDGFLAYAFPPWALIPQVLRKFHASSSVQMTLVAPYWPQRSWFLDLLDLVVDSPVALPSPPDLLKHPHFHRRHLRIHRLFLHAWRLSSDLPGLKDSPLVQLSGWVCSSPFLLHELPAQVVRLPPLVPF